MKWFLIGVVICVVLYFAYQVGSLLDSASEVPFREKKKE